MQKKTYKDVDYSYEIKVKVSKETYRRWKELITKITKITGHDNPSKVLEFAIIETLNIPNSCYETNWQCSHPVNYIYDQRKKTFTDKRKGI